MYVLQVENFSKIALYLAKCEVNVFLDFYAIMAEKRFLAKSAR